MRRFPPVFILSVLLTCGGCTPQPRETLCVATINLAHGRGASTNPLGQLGRPRRIVETNLAAIADCLKREAPDVVALQEADASCSWSGNFDHVTFLADAAGYPHRHHGLHADFDLANMKLRYGTALLARRALVDSRTFTFDIESVDGIKGFVVARTEFAGRPLIVVSVHLHPRSKSSRRRQGLVLIRELQRIRRPDPAEGGIARSTGAADVAATRFSSGREIIVMGDFNTTWEQTDDALRMIARELDLHPFEPNSNQQNTYPSSDPQDRIDWILISSGLQFSDYRRWPDRISDHLGVMATLVWR